MSCEKRLAVSYDSYRSVVQPLDEDDILWIPSSYLASNNVVISIDDLVGHIGVTEFCQLTDVPVDYTGFSNCIVQVNQTETGLCYGNLPYLTNTFVALGNLKNVTIAGVSDGQVLCYDDSSLSWVPSNIDFSAASLLDLNDTPNSYAGQACKLARVDCSESNIEFVTVAEVASEFNLSDLHDVCMTTESLGQVLTYNGVIWSACDLPVTTDQYVRADSSDITSGFLSDKVDNVTLVVDEIAHELKVKDNYFAFKHHTHCWTDLNLAGFTLDNLDDVDICCIQNGDVLVWNSATCAFDNEPQGALTDELVKVTSADVAGYLCDKIDTLNLCVNSSLKISVVDNLYAAFNHNHDSRYYQQCQIDNMLSNYSLTTHNHDTCYYTQTCLNNGVLDSRYYTQSVLNGYLDNKSDCGHNHDGRYYTQTCLDNGQLDNRYFTEAEITSFLNTKSDCGHIHDDRYYTETEIDTFLACKSDCDHNHDSRYFTQSCLTNGILDSRYYTESEMNVLLANKANLSHTHAWTEISKTGSSINDLGDVNTTLASADDLLQYNGSCWVSIPFPNIADEKVKATPTDSMSGYLCDKVDNCSIKVCNNQLEVESSLFALASHNHDDRYYTKSETDGFLALKSDCGHNHDSRYYQQCQIDSMLSGYSLCTHNHDSRYYQQCQIDDMLSCYSLCGHTHDDRYYIKSCINNLLGQKADICHTHVWSDICKDGSSLSDLADVTACPVQGSCDGCIIAWDGSTWALNNVDTLQGSCGRISLFSGDTLDYLENKADPAIFCVDHTNSYLEIVPNVFAPFNHNHDSRYYQQCQVDAMLDNKIDCGYNFDDRYYQQCEVDSMLSCYSLCGHTHDTRYYTQTCLNNGVLDNRYYTECEVDGMLSCYSLCGHTHTWDEVSKVGSSINDLGDVDTSIVNPGSVLSWNGSKWIPASNAITDELVKTTPNDSSAGYLCNKIDNSTIVVDSNVIKVADNIYLPYNYNFDDRYYQQCEVDSMLSCYSLCGHNHDDRYYTQSQLDGGELDTRYYTEAEVDNLLDGYLPVGTNFDTCYYTQSCLSNGVLDNRYYTESETDNLLANKADCGHTHTWNEVSKVGSSINDLGDVNLSGLVCNQVLGYNGSSWVNASLNGAEVNYTRSFSITAGPAVIDGDGSMLTVTMVNHGFLIDQPIAVSGASTGAINKDYTIKQIVNSNTFTLISPIGATISQESVTVTPDTIWSSPAPTTLGEAIDRLALALSSHMRVEL